MKRFIRYLYEYEQNSPRRNVGFVKVEETEECSVVQIHGKGIALSPGEKLKQYSFFEDGEVCVCIPQGEADTVYPELNTQFYYTRETVGIPENYEKMQGVLLESDSGEIYAALWNENPVNFQRRSIWIAKPRSGTSEASELSENVQNEIPKRELPPKEVTQKETLQEEPLPGENIEKENAPVETVQEETKQRGMPRKAWSAKKIQRPDIARLAHCEWRLANNKFLLHGYYNYHHLILLENETCVMLGVPGIYHVREAMLAADFGFPDFVTPEQFSSEPDGDEVQDESFGYWCRTVKMKQETGR